MGIILFIDAENFKKKIEEVLKSEGKLQDLEWHTYDFRGLFNKVLEGIQPDESFVYLAKISEHEDTKKKSHEIIEKQRKLKTHLESQSQSFKVIIAGRVRGQYETRKFRKNFLVFKEKGVDVRIAVDMVSMACDSKFSTAILASSDSDLQPAIKEVKKRGKVCLYLGFENSPNKGISYSCDRTVLVRNSEVIQFLPQKLI